MISTKAIFLPLIVAALVMTGCGRLPENTDAAPDNSQTTGDDRDEARGEGTSIFDLFNRQDNETRVSVNKYLWTASLEVLDFLPVQSVDPFTGVIVTGLGIPPGGGTAYRATVLIDDPALDARSLNVALQTSGGRPVSKATSRAVEDAILSRARQLRIADNKL